MDKEVKQSAFIDHVIKVTHSDGMKYAFRVYDMQDVPASDIFADFDTIQDADNAGGAWVIGFYAGRKAADDERGEA